MGRPNTISWPLVLESGFLGTNRDDIDEEGKQTSREQDRVGKGIKGETSLAIMIQV